MEPSPLTRQRTSQRLAGPAEGADRGQRFLTIEARCLLWVRAEVRLSRRDVRLVPLAEIALGCSKAVQAGH
jgi:hypothetical protein